MQAGWVVARECDVLVGHLCFPTSAIQGENVVESSHKRRGRRLSRVNAFDRLLAVLELVAELNC